MIYWPTTLLPSSPPYSSFDNIMNAICDRCMKDQYDPDLSEELKSQSFDYAMALIDFWYVELTKRGIDCDSRKR